MGFDELNQALDSLMRFGWVVLFIMLWETVWKFFALYTAGKNHQKGWYMALFFLNTVGILPILYLQFFQKKSSKSAHAS